MEPMPAGTSRQKAIDSREDAEPWQSKMSDGPYVQRGEGLTIDVTEADFPWG